MNGPLIDEDLIKQIDQQGAIREKERFNREQRIEREYQRNLDLENRRSQIKKLADIDPEVQAASFVDFIDAHVRVIQQPMPIIDDELGKALKIDKGDMLTFAAKPKQGKTTLATNLAWALFNAGKKVLLISNEEDTNAIYGRIAGIEHNHAYNKVIHEATPDETKESLRQAVYRIAQTIHVRTNSDMDFTSAQGIIELLEYVGHSYDLVIIDYISRISTDLDNPSAESWSAQEKVIDYLNRFKNHTPTIVFTQIRALSKDDDDIASRIEGRKKLQQVSTNTIEIIKDARAGTTLLKFHYVRFCRDIDQWYLKFDKSTGKLISIDEMEWTMLSAGVPPRKTP